MFNKCLSTLARCVTHVPWPRKRSRHVRASIFNEKFFKLWNSAYCTSEDVFVKHLELLDERRYRTYYGHTNLYVNSCVTRVCSQRREDRWREPPPLLPFHHRQLLKSPRVSVPIVFFRTAACTCSASTTTTSSMPP